MDDKMQTMFEGLCQSLHGKHCVTKWEKLIILHVNHYIIKMVDFTVKSNSCMLAFICQLLQAMSNCNTDQSEEIYRRN